MRSFFVFCCFVVVDFSVVGWTDWIVQVVVSAKFPFF
jgi:hypothetical protein